MSANNSLQRTIKQLLTEACNEFKEDSRFSTGSSMIELTTFFDETARGVHGTRFIWSAYNKSQWEKFVRRDMSWCGSCAFSTEMAGEMPGIHGLGLGGVRGPYPFQLWDLTGRFGPQKLRAAVTELTKYSLEGVG